MPYRVFPRTAWPPTEPSSGGSRPFDGDEFRFRAWLMTVARHRAIDWRRRNRRNPLLLEENNTLDARMPVAPDAASVVIERWAMREAITLISRLLPSSQAQVVILRALVGLDVADVARVMGRRAGTVRVLAHRGLRTLEIGFEPSP